MIDFPIQEKEKVEVVEASVNLNYLTLRKYLGVLGIAMPFVLIMGNDFLIEESISHYYYTKMSVVFTGTLIAFGLFLISYKGYDKKQEELVSDNVITNLAGLFAWIVAFIPTACSYCAAGVPNGHDDIVRTTIHLVSAGMFMIIMGYMAYIQFAKSKKTDAITVRRNRIFRFCGLLIWAVVILLLLEHTLGFQFSSSDVFWGETVALICFGIAWLIKSKSLGKFGL